jgi:hypothetical protein
MFGKLKRIEILEFNQNNPPKYKIGDKIKNEIVIDIKVINLSFWFGFKRDINIFRQYTLFDKKTIKIREADEYFL